MQKLISNFIYINYINAPAFSPSNSSGQKILKEVKCKIITLAQ